jgi:hypothetical protein
MKAMQILLKNDIVMCYHNAVNSNQQKTLQAIFVDSIRPTINWSDIESLLLSLGASKKEGAGSSVGFSLNEVDIVVHRPHPRKETDKGAVKLIRTFLTNAGVQP